MEGENVPVNDPRSVLFHSERILQELVNPMANRLTGTGAVDPVVLKTARYLLVESSASAVHAIRLLVLKSWRL